MITEDLINTTNKMYKQLNSSNTTDKETLTKVAQTVIASLEQLIGNRDFFRLIIERNKNYKEDLPKFEDIAGRINTDPVDPTIAFLRTERSLIEEKGLDFSLADELINEGPAALRKIREWLTDPENIEDMVVALQRKCKDLLKTIEQNSLNKRQVDQIKLKLQRAIHAICGVIIIGISVADGEHSPERSNFDQIVPLLAANLGGGLIIIAIWSIDL